MFSSQKVNNWLHCRDNEADANLVDLRNLKKLNDFLENLKEDIRFEYPDDFAMYLMNLTEEKATKLMGYRSPSQVIKNIYKMCDVKKIDFPDVWTVSADGREGIFRTWLDNAKELTLKPTEPASSFTGFMTSSTVRASAIRQSLIDSDRNQEPKKPKQGLVSYMWQKRPALCCNRSSENQADVNVNDLRLSDGSLGEGSDVAQFGMQNVGP